MHPSPPSPALEFPRWIIWEDEYLLAVNKPAGVLSQGGEGGEGINVVDLARAYLGRGGIGVIHRLDRNVSGVMLVAKEPVAARALSEQIARGEVERVYVAVVRGEPSADEFEVDAWLAKDEARNVVRAMAPETLAALPAKARAAFKPARTRVRVLERFRSALGPCATLEVRPLTGRSHQIRVHLAFAGLPIVGDPKYGVTARGLNRPLLHARAMTFRHPVSGQSITVEAPIPWTHDDVLTLRPLSQRRSRSRPLGG